ncbi:MAG: hypothetical protein ACK5JT_23575 [Hyphomicrobiaceae bacterium]
MKIVLFAAAALAMTTTMTAAHSPQPRHLGYGSSTNATHRIDQRQDRQAVRIRNGVRSGQITRREARNLKSEQAYIRHLERTAKRDGHISHREARRIASAQKAASRHIARERNDSQMRKRGLWHRRWW